MPCWDARDDVRTVTQVVDGVHPKYKDEAHRLSRRCKRLTQLLCKAGRARYRKTEIPVEVIKWWDDHCKLDKKHGEPW